jgi:hypothetical protein
MLKLVLLGIGVPHWYFQLNSVIITNRHSGGASGIRKCFSTRALTIKGEWLSHIMRHLRAQHLVSQLIQRSKYEQASISQARPSRLGHTGRRCDHRGFIWSYRVGHADPGSPSPVRPHGYTYTCTFYAYAHTYVHIYTCAHVAPTAKADCDSHYHPRSYPVSARDRGRSLPMAKRGHPSWRDSWFLHAGSVGRGVGGPCSYPMAKGATTLARSMRVLVLPPTIDPGVSGCPC